MLFIVIPFIIWIISAVVINVIDHKKAQVLHQLLLTVTCL